MENVPVKDNVCCVVYFLIAFFFFFTFPLDISGFLEQTQADSLMCCFQSAASLLLITCGITLSSVNVCACGCLCEMTK